MKRALVVVLLLGGGLAASCTLTEDDPPDRSCRNSTDCFRAQGETCNTTTKLCEVMPDAGTALQAPQGTDDEEAP